MVKSQAKRFSVIIISKDVQPSQVFFEKNWNEVKIFFNGALTRIWLCLYHAYQVPYFLQKKKHPNFYSSASGFPVSNIFFAG